MIDLGHSKRLSPLRRLKWLTTLTASVAGAISLGVAINWVIGGNLYHWTVALIALGVMAAALVVRHAIALRLDDGSTGALPD
jgi:hypothetical protein